MTAPSTRREAPAQTAPAPEPDAGGGPLSAPKRALLLVVGSVALVIGVIGIVVPVLPTTPFLLVTAACYARSSTRLYNWLLGQPSLGPIVAEWRATRSLPPGVKARALVAVALTFTVSIILVDAAVLRLVLLAVAIVLTIFLVRLPTAAAARPSAGTRASVNQGEAP